MKVNTMNTVETSRTFPSDAELVRWRKATPLLNYDHSSIADLIARRGWLQLREFERIGAIYNFVRDEIAFGYNVSDDLPASTVLSDGIGQCNTKGTLLMALLRAVGVACRFHGFTIHKALQKGVINGLWYQLAPSNIIHSWVEIWTEGTWVYLEGVILDSTYLSALQRQFADHQGPFCSFGVATPDLQCPPIDWVGKNTSIQRDGINRDFGLFDAPDDFYAQHGANLSGAKRWLFTHFARQNMNRNVARIRSTQ
jgi:hypothetical protein